MTLTAAAQSPYFIEHEQGKGVIARFHLDTAEITTQLSALRSAGADGISLSPWLMQGAVANGAGDSFLDWDPSTGRLAAQAESNFLSLLHLIAQSGFHFIQVAPQFYAPDPRKVGLSAFTACALFMDWLTGYLDSLRIPYLIDLVPEFNDVYKTNPGFAQYVRAMWARGTLLQAPNALPCWRYSMSFIPANMDCLTDAFQGNPPAILLPHVYTNEPGYASFLDCLKSVNVQLCNLGLSSQDVMYGETDTLPEDIQSAYANMLVSFVQTTKRRVLRVCPWPVTPVDAMGVQMSVWPQIVSRAWTTVGA